MQAKYSANWEVGRAGEGISINVETTNKHRRRFGLQPHGPGSQKTSSMDTNVKTSQKTEFFEPTLYSSMERQIKIYLTKQRSMNKDSTIKDKIDFGRAVARGSLRSVS
jgi:hypothetical protein